MVTVYTKSMCPNCVKAKRLLESFGVGYQEVRIDQDPKVLEMLLARGHRAAPVICVEGQQNISGFNPRVIEETLRAAGLI